MNCSTNAFNSINMNFMDYKGVPGHLWYVQVCAGTGCSYPMWREHLWFWKQHSHLRSERTSVSWSWLIHFSKASLNQDIVFLSKANIIASSSAINLALFGSFYWLERAKRAQHDCFHWHAKIYAVLHRNQWRHNYFCTENVLLFFPLHCFPSKSKMYFSIFNNI